MKNTFILGPNLYENALLAIKNTSLYPDKTNLIIVPDRFSLQSELMIFAENNISCTFNTFVMPISKFCQSFLESAENIIDSQKQKFLIRHAIRLSKPYFKCFKGNLNSSLVGDISKTVSLLKSCQIQPNSLSCNGGEYLKNKIHDLNLIFSNYENLLLGRMDNNDLLNVFLSKINQIDFSSFTFSFVGFDALTIQTTQIVKALAEKSNAVTLSVPYSKNKNRVVDLDTYTKFKDKIESKESHVLFLEEPKNKNQKALQKYFLGENVEFEKNFVSAIECDSIYEEIDFVLNKISQGVKNGHSFGDFAIACCDIEKYKPYFEDRIKDYNIEYFFDSSKQLRKTIITNFLLCFFNLFVENFKKQDILNFVSNEFTKLSFAEKSSISLLISNKQLFESGLEDNLCFLDDSQKQEISFLLELKSKYGKKIENSKIVHDFVLIAKEFLKDFNVCEKIESLCVDFEKNKDFNNQKLHLQIYDKTVVVLDTIDEVLGEQEAKAKEFVEIFEDAVCDVKISTVPISNNCVYIGDITDSFFSQVKKLFVVGASSGDLPKTIVDCGLILDDDIKNIKSEIAPTIKMINKRNRYAVFCNLSRASEKIIFSYPTSFGGEITSFSQTAQEMCKLAGKSVVSKNLLDFVPDPTKAGVMLLNSCHTKTLAKEKLYSLAKRKTISKKNINSLYHAIKSDISPEELKLFNPVNHKQKIKDARGLFFKNNSTKISQLEEYFLCPYRHFASYGLKLKKVESGHDSRHIGTLIHKIVSLVSMQKFSNFDDCEKYIKDIFKKQELEEFEIFKLSKSNKILLSYLEYESVNLAMSIYAQQNSSLFKIKSIEKFVSYPDFFAGNIGLRGIVDRTDEFGDNFIIVDYKSSNVEFNQKSVYCGQKIQVLVYAKLFEILNKKRCVGTFYLPVNKEENIVYHKFKGFYVDDTQIALALDESVCFDNPSSQFFPIKISTSEKNVQNNEIVLSKQLSAPTKNLQNMIDYAISLCNKATQEILGGYIQCKPLKNSCSFCPYLAMCNFDTKQEDFERSVDVNLSGFFDEVKHEWN